jgi:hypothetical protein
MLIKLNLKSSLVFCDFKTQNFKVQTDLESSNIDLENVKFVKYTYISKQKRFKLTSGHRY